MARLWLLRHAQPLIAAGVCYGQLDMAADAAATGHAAQQAAATLPPHIATVWTSPLQRCELLAQHLKALRPDLSYKKSALISEINFGHWEGQPWSTIARAELDAWAAQFADYAPGGGESLAQMLHRVRQALNLAHGLGGDVLWISHAGVARCVDWLLGAHGARMPLAPEWPAAAPGFGQWVGWDVSIA